MIHCIDWFSEYVKRLLQMSYQLKKDLPVKPKCYIDRITFNNDEELEINPSDIVVFVGPNNVGKSQA